MCCLTDTCGCNRYKLESILASNDNHCRDCVFGDSEVMIEFFKNLFGVQQKSDIRADFQSISNSFSDVKDLLEQMMRKEQLLTSNILVRSGFLIHHYELRYDRLTITTLEELKMELSALVQREESLRRTLKSVLVSLARIEIAYRAIIKKDLNSLLLLPHLDNAIACSKVAQVRINQLIDLLDQGLNMNKKASGKQANDIISSLERMLNQIYKFIIFLEQISKKALDFEVRSFYPEPRTYGRAGSLKEIKRIKRTGFLASSKDLVPVFDAPLTVVDQITGMSKDQRRNFFAAIGVLQVDAVIFFKTRLKPFNAENPIFQTNGLREYKFPNEIPVEITNVLYN